MITENLVMDPTTGKPLPVSQLVEKRQAELAVRGDTINKMVPNNNKPVYKCSVCNRSFTSKSMLVHHNEKVRHYIDGSNLIHCDYCQFVI